MIELVDTLPDINVAPAEFKRLLGFPREKVLRDRSRELADWARAWYARNGHPWVYARQCERLEIVNDTILIDGVTFHSPRLLKMFHEAQADSAILVALSAGPEIEAAALDAWNAEKPDDYFFLETFGSAIVEHLTANTGARLCSWAEPRGLAVLPHYSPGYPEWDINEQPRLLDLIKKCRSQKLPAALEAFDTGMLRPKKSLLALFGLTHKTELVRKLTDLTPCENCSYQPCQFRRSPYAGAPTSVTELETFRDDDEDAIEEEAPLAEPLTQNATYSVSPKALARWAKERLTLNENSDGSIDALFKYEGTTCGNRPFFYHYRIQLAPRAQGYIIRDQSCAPAPGDEAHRYQCRYMSNAEHLMVAIDHEKPLQGQPINDILSWQRPTAGAGCYCEPSSRKHKWGIVLETVHYALAQREKMT
jgi:hypothetical protein